MEGFKEYNFMSNGTHIVITFMGKNESTESAKKDNSTSKFADYDSTGAMHFIVAVIIVYSCISVIGVFVTRFFSERKKKNSHNMDEEANVFLKQTRLNRGTLERQRRKHEMKKVLGGSSVEKKSSGRKDYSQGGIISLINPSIDLSTSKETLDDSGRWSTKKKLKEDFDDPVCHSDEDLAGSSEERPTRSVSFYVQREKQ